MRQNEGRLSAIGWCTTKKTDCQAWMHYTLYVHGPIMVVPGARTSCSHPQVCLRPRQTGSQSISFWSPAAFPNASPQYLFIWGSRSSLSTSCLRTTPKSSTRRSFGRARWSTSTPAGHKLDVSALDLSMCSASQCSSSWLNSEVRILASCMLYVVRLWSELSWKKMKMLCLWVKYDVESLFTSIPVSKAIKICKRRLRMDKTPNERAWMWTGPVLPEQHIVPYGSQP